MQIQDLVWGPKYINKSYFGLCEPTGLSIKLSFLYVLFIKSLKPCTESYRICKEPTTERALSLLGPSGVVHLILGAAVNESSVLWVS